MIEPDSATTSSSSSSVTSGGRTVYWAPDESFDQDDPAGHGTHTAGSAAGATLNVPAETVTCNDTDRLSCVGGCIDGDLSYSSDDLVSWFFQLAATTDIDRICPMYGCDNATTEVCLGDDVGKTLTDHGGMAQGAKLAIFDVFWGSNGLSSFVGNGLWEACMETGCKIHSNSYGSDDMCSLSPMEPVYDDFMYRVSLSFFLDRFFGVFVHSGVSHICVRSVHIRQASHTEGILRKTDLTALAPPLVRSLRYNAMTRATMG